MEFKDRLRMLRKAKGWNQAQLGQKVHLGGTSISNYETGLSEPSIQTILALAAVLGVSVEYLLCAPPVGEFPKPPEVFETLYRRLSKSRQEDIIILMQMYLERDEEEKLSKQQPKED